MFDFSYYDQIWVYSELEAFKSRISKEDFVVISNLQRLHRIYALEKPDPVQLSLQNQIVTSENEDSTNSNDSNTDSHVTPRGDKVTRSSWSTNHWFRCRCEAYSRQC